MRKLDISKLKKPKRIPLPEPQYALFQDDKIEGCRAMGLCLEGAAELAKRGLLRNDSNPICWDQSVLWLELGDQPVAVLTYKFIDWQRDMWVSFAYTQEGHRLRGLYSRLYTELRKIAREKKALRISGGTDYHNHVMRKAAESVGREPLYVVYSERL